MVNTKQVGGSHYRNMAIEPAHFAMVNRWDANAFCTLKHLSRFRVKGGVLDLQKALHYVDMRQADIAHYWPPLDEIRMFEYLAKNNIRQPEAAALMHLERWVRCNDGVAHVKEKINDVVRIYGEELAAAS